jgi:hypothetical protein
VQPAELDAASDAFKDPNILQKIDIFLVQTDACPYCFETMIEN